MKRHYGISLFELLTTLAIVAIVVAIAAPAMVAIRDRARIVRVQTELSEVFLAATRHAVAGGVATVLCPSRDQAGCIEGHDWSHGWLAFADLNGDRKFGAGDVQLRRAGTLSAGLHLYSSPGRPRIVFQPQGDNAGTNATFTICAGTTRQLGVLALSNGGRFHLVAARQDHAAACIST
ncbi:hypothetical protein CNO08_07125 [Lysobacter capsici]|nr:hypothetical protein CNO08_07125 [Lysobacter capsici]